MTTLRWYRLGEGTLGVESVDEALARRFEEIYGHCAVAKPLNGPQVGCRVTAQEGGTVQVDFADPEPLDEARFLRTVFPERGYEPVTAADGAIVVRLPGTGDEVRLREGRLTAPAHAAWQPLVANLAVSRLLRLQRSIIFFHAASFDLRGRGLMVCGPKRSGKTTLAVGLAARGHTLLGDEVAALRLSDRSLLPFRRSLAIREGPSSAASGPLLDRTPVMMERFPDGEVRRRLQVAAVSSLPVPESTPLTAVIILRNFNARTEIRPLRLGPELIGSLTPMAASLWDRPAGATALRLIGALSGVKLYDVQAGPPDEVADAVERLMED